MKDRSIPLRQAVQAEQECRRDKGYKHYEKEALPYVTRQSLASKFREILLCIDLAMMLQHMATQELREMRRKRGNAPYKPRQTVMSTLLHKPFCESRTSEVPDAVHSELTMVEGCRDG